MGFMDLFRKKKKVKTNRRKRRKPYNSKIRQAYDNLKSDIKSIQVGTEGIKEALSRHSKQLAEHSDLINDHFSRLEKLENLVSTPQPTPVINPTTNRLNEMTNQLIASITPVEIPTDRLDMDRFSTQERKILSVFLVNQDMSLSYADIASALNKSPNTIKNQMREINMKANLFDKAIDNENRNRFKLKKHLTIEKTLNKG